MIRQCLHLFRWRRGFTLTEVMVAMFIGAIGVAGIAGLQTTLAYSQLYTQDLGRSRRIAQNTLAELRTEAAMWSTLDLSDLNASDTPLLAWALFDGPDVQGGTTEVWVPRRTVDGTASPTFNALGIPNDPSDPRVVANNERLNSYNQRYCVHYSVEVVGESVAAGELFRAQVRVYFPVASDALAPAPIGVADCGWSDVGDMTDAADRGQFRFTQLSSVIFRHPEY